jgi:hypothetical protein
MDNATGDYRIRAWGLPVGDNYQLRAWDYDTDSSIAWFGSAYNTANVDDTGNYGGFGMLKVKYWLQTVDHDETLWESNLVNN